MNDDERHEDHPQEGELVGGGEDLRELHARSLKSCEADCEPSGALPESRPGVSATEGSSPVLARKRWEREGRLPSGRSSSTRSMRCMGKKTTAGVNGSPSRTMTVRSSNDASSAPLKLSPSGARARIIPQNFSRGLESVAITTAPDTNGPPDVGCVVAT